MLFVTCTVYEHSFLTSSHVPSTREFPQPFVRTEDREGRGSVATKSVGAQFSEQLAQLRSRIDATVPHYIRCLKPNDELKPDTFDPRMIVDQLRCGGVLEAVRVSRAGYPTRYPHELFRNRYYVLGKAEDMRRTPKKRWGRGAGSSSGDESVVQKLVSKIAFDIWEADHEAMLAKLEASRSPLAAVRDDRVALLIPDFSHRYADRIASLSSSFVESSKRRG